MSHVPIFAIPPISNRRTAAADQLTRQTNKSTMATPTENAVDNRRLPFMPIAPAGNKRPASVMGFAPIDRIQLPELEDEITPLSQKLPLLRRRHFKTSKVCRSPNSVVPLDQAIDSFLQKNSLIISPVSMEDDRHSSFAATNSKVLVFSHEEL